MKLKCNCGQVYEMERDHDMPEDATGVGCNWCPACEDTAKEYYFEWYTYDEEGEPEPDDPNQLVLFSVADEILNNHKPKEKIDEDYN